MCKQTCDKIYMWNGRTPGSHKWLKRMSDYWNRRKAQQIRLKNWIQGPNPLELEMPKAQRAVQELTVGMTSA